MSYINMKSRSSFDFFAPYTEEGDRCVQIPFPVAVTRKPEDKSLVHDCNPQIADIAAGTAATTFTLDTQVQAGSLLIVKNASANAQTIGKVACAASKVTTLMYDGNAYISIGTSDISE
ncbi:hypothetical protein AAH014_03990 [Bacteroides uniformis]|uniref:hypothetical protein n=1 Tax=Bacteroides uniformis TaxID=820 RepID=UPI0039B4B957